MLKWFELLLIQMTRKIMMPFWMRKNGWRLKHARIDLGGRSGSYNIIISYLINNYCSPGLYLHHIELGTKAPLAGSLGRFSNLAETRKRPYMLTATKSDAMPRLRLQLGGLLQKPPVGVQT
jgi:hypothetical protein